MIRVTSEQILSLAPNALLIYRKAVLSADAMLARYGINESGLRLAHFAAQILHESGGFRLREESLNYSVDGLLATFGKRIERRVAESIGRTPERKADQERIANLVYGGAWGRKNLGNTEPGDGWRFRGRGPLQLTGRANYRKFGDRLGIPLESRPELALDPQYLLEIPACYWLERGCNEAADADDLTRVTKLVNGGSIGLEDRSHWLAKTKAVWLNAPHEPRHDPKCEGLS